MKCNPLRWLWGLIPIFALSWLTVQFEHGRIEADLAARVATQLKGAGIDYAKIAFTGRDGILSGQAVDEESPQKARQLTEGIWGVRIVEDKSTLVERASNFLWSAVRSANRVELRGMVPNEATRQSIVGLARTTFANTEVVDSMTIRRGVPSQDTWLSGVSFGIKQLAALKTGEARLDGLGLAVSGEAGTLDAYRGVKTALASQLPRGIRLTDEKIAAPVVKPYVWGARALGTQVTLTGFVPAERVREEIAAAAKAAFPAARIVDQMQLGEGAPASFNSAATGSIKHLAQLEEGRADLSDTRVTLAGTANDAATADTVRGGVRQALPRTFSLVDQIRVREVVLPTPPLVVPPPPATPPQAAAPAPTPPPTPPAPPVAAAQPAPTPAAPATAPPAAAPPTSASSVPLPRTVSPFTTSLDLDPGRVILSGFVPSPAARDLIEAAAKSRFPGRAIDNRLEVAAGAPAGWQGCVEAGMIGLQKASTGKIGLSDRKLTVTGVTDDDDQIEAAPANVRLASLGACDSDVKLQAAPEPDLNWRAVYSGQVVTLSGDVTSATAKRSLVDQAGRLLPNARVVDQMRVVEHGSRKWPQVADAGLRMLADLKSGEATLSRQQLTVSGEADDQSVVVGVRERLGRIARGYSGTEQVRVAVVAPPPAPQPPAVQPPTAAPPPAAPPLVDPRARACQEGLRTAAKEGIINFERAKADLARESLPTLNKLAQIARDCPQVRIEIEGHTDAEGTPERNARLADRRARAVADYLVKAGVEAGKLVAIGYGETRPVAPNDTPENRARNRRIEFTVRE